MIALKDVQAYLPLNSSWHLLWSSTKKNEAAHLTAKWAHRAAIFDDLILDDHPFDIPSYISECILI